LEECVLKNIKTTFNYIKSKKKIIEKILATPRVEPAQSLPNFS